jgi:uncharacterized protein YbbC (DUF1343 family)/beta-glucosidase-like glycosyl hydrolase
MTGEPRRRGKTNAARAWRWASPCAALLVGAFLLSIGQPFFPLSASTSSTAPELGTGEPSAAKMAPARLSRSQRRWVNSTLEAMTLRQKAAQLIMVRVYGHYNNPRSAAHQALLDEVREQEVGGLVLFRSELETVPRLLNSLQSAARVPLLVAADVERSLSFRVGRGTVPLPYAMAVGATRSEEAARFTGEVTARESRALGIHWALAPVADVNNNPANPVINIRSYGEEPELVARLSAAFIHGARRGGVLTTAKHFPGHGDTAVDSHRALPVVTAERSRLSAVELVPFRRAVAAGVDSIMLGHIAVPAVDPSGTPATLSPTLAGELLRNELGFRGLIVTDALEMAGLRPAWTGEAAVRAVAAGADVLLLPRDSRVAIQSVVRAVAEGQIDEARLDTSVRLLLATKARLGLHRARLVNRDTLEAQVARPEDMERAAELARASVTLVRNQGDVLPLTAERPLRLLHLALASDIPPDSIQRAELTARRVPFESRTLGIELTAETAAEIVAAAPGFTHVVVSAFIRGVAGTEGRGGMPPGQVQLLRRLLETGVPVIVVSLGSPYLLAQLPEVPVYLCTYGAAASSQRAALAALFGEADISGRLPVTLPGLYPNGHGIELQRRPMTLAPARAGESPLRAGGAEEIDRVLAGFLERRAFPGAVVAVGHRGTLAHLRPYGRLSYAEDSPPVAADTLYDLASLTKVIATTSMAMILVDEGRLDLDKPVRDYLPRFAGAGKEDVTVRHLLTHSSGVDWWAPLFRELRGKAAYLERIQAMDLVYEPGSKAVYSDLGLILLGEILERVAGRSLDSFVRQRVFQPLGMNDTSFRPPAELRQRIAPTEVDPWRGRLLQGEVHDENASALGGVAPHAGLFSTAGDLARFAQMILNGGVLEHRRIISRRTVEEFTRLAGVPESSRALGWDTRSPVGYSSAGALLSARSFGHTGFTGTSIWLDPERQLFVILLTNRVHPSRENQLIREARPAVADAVVRALADQRAATREPDLEAEPIPVRVGLEELAMGNAPGLENKRLGLVVHRASVTFDGRHAIDVVRDAGLDLVRLFTPEHGLRGDAAAGETVASGRDPVSGLPLISLYGERRKPDPGELADLDALVFDLQGAGVRFYTYVSTLILCLEAAAEAGIDFVVLDRPNPLGGERIEGPVSAPRDQVPASFVNLAPGPLVHGLTLGEMARYVNAGLARPARLTVIPMSGWKRWMSWADTGRPWIPPSPNLRSAEAALAYPGTALLEAANVSEGRGTHSPFLLLGAPWLETKQLELSVPGFALEPTRFVPEASPAAPHPKYLDEECAGLRVRVTDPRAARSYRLGLELVAALSQQPGFAWRGEGAALTRLLGTDRVGQQLLRQTPVAEILAADRADHEAWLQGRRAALLY